ncbi:MAG: plastocyanin/azurin family copper-binding protein [Gemmatimonadota bacterium]
MTILSRIPALGRTSVAAVLATSLLSFGCSDAAGPPDDEGPTQTTSVSVLDNRFAPPANAIAPGATVTWSWGGSNPHNVTFDDDAIGNSSTQTGGSFQKAFADAGEYTYFCTVHGRSVMSGRVVVGS